MTELIKIPGEDLFIKIIDEPTPIPPPEDFVLIDSAVKGVNGYQNNYQGAGWMDGVNVPGWYLGTLSYTGVTNSYDAMKFNGTQVEWYTEKGPTHGIVGVSIDGLTETMVDLYAPTFEPMVKVYESGPLEQALHTLKLRCTGTKNPLSSNVYLITDMVKVFNPQPVPDVPIPPSDEVIVRPGESIKQAVESVAAGKTVRLIEGMYNETQFTPKLNVSLKGAGKDKTVISFVGTMAQNSEEAIIMLKTDGSRANGNQEISGFTINGKNGANAGIMVNNRDAVKILDVKITDTNRFGAWLKNSSNSEFANCELLNTSWASTGWVMGELCIGETANALIHHNLFKTTKVNAQGLSLNGYGIKAVWPGSTLTNLKIYSNKFDLIRTSIWQNGQSPNIDIELCDVIYAGIEISDNDFSTMGVSAAAHRPTKSGRLMIKKNRFNWSSTAHIELVCSNVTIEENIFRGAAMMTANFQPNGKWVDQIVNNNDFVSNNSNPSWGGTFLIGPDGAQMNITNNKITKGNYPLVKYMGVTGGVTVDGSNTIN